MTICILGSGLSALTLAKALVNQNIFVDILTNKKNLKLDRSRTLGISKTNINFFNKNIINIEKILWKLKKIEIFSENLGKEKLLNFENKNQLFSIIKNYQLCEILKKDLSKNSFFKKKYSDSRNISFLKDYDLIINCDYSHHITKKFFDKKIKKKYKSLAYTTIIEHKKILNNTATQIFTQKGPLAFLPISSNQTSIVFSIHNSVSKKENIKELIKKYNHKYKIYKIHEINFFELSALNLRSYYHNNILAFGDLLHKVHPLAGQGFNMTLRDIKVFLKIIKDKQSLGLPLNSTINYEFEKRLKHKNFIFSNGIDLIHNFFNFERKIKNKTISKSIQYIAKNPSLNRVFTKIADEGIFF